jgi:hypothetical protein
MRLRRARHAAGPQLTHAVVAEDGGERPRLPQHGDGTFLSSLLLILQTLSTADRLFQSSGHRRLGGVE